MKSIFPSRLSKLLRKIKNYLSKKLFSPKLPARLHQKKKKKSHHYKGNIFLVVKIKKIINNEILVFLGFFL